MGVGLMLSSTVPSMSAERKYRSSSYTPKLTSAILAKKTIAPGPIPPGREVHRFTSHGVLGMNIAACTPCNDRPRGNTEVDLDWMLQVGTQPRYCGTHR